MRNHTRLFLLWVVFGFIVVHGAEPVWAADKEVKKEAAKKVAEVVKKAVTEDTKSGGESATADKTDRPIRTDFKLGSEVEQPVTTVPTVPAPPLAPTAGRATYNSVVPTAPSVADPRFNMPQVPQVPRPPQAPGPPTIPQVPSAPRTPGLSLPQVPTVPQVPTAANPNNKEEQGGGGEEEKPADTKQSDKPAKPVSKPADGKMMQAIKTMAGKADTAKKADRKN